MAIGMVWIGAAILFCSSQDSPPQGRILFMRQGEFWIANPDGSGQARLTQQRGRYPCGSPDGAKVVYSSVGEGVFWKVHVMQVDGGNVRRLTEGNGDDRHPVFDRDGTKIAFYRVLKRRGTIHLVDADGKNPRVLTEGSDNDRHPTFRPDGKRIVFSRSGSGTSGRFKIHLLDVDGKNPTRLTEGEGDEHFPAFSPDGCKIAFTSSRAGSASLCVMDADGKNRREVTQSAATGGDWAPIFLDNTTLVFCRFTNGKNRLMRIGLDGKGLRDLGEGSDYNWGPPRLLGPAGS